ncbi:hypothetical protein D3C78_1457960 [compost metagenome]
MGTTPASNGSFLLRPQARLPSRLETPSMKAIRPKTPSRKTAKLQLWASRALDSVMPETLQKREVRAAGCCCAGDVRLIASLCRGLKQSDAILCLCTAEVNLSIGIIFFIRGNNHARAGNRRRARVCAFPWAKKDPAEAGSNVP